MVLYHGQIIYRMYHDADIDQYTKKSTVKAALERRRIVYSSTSL